MPSNVYDRRRVLELSGATLATVATAGCLNNSSSDSPTVTMTDDFEFNPKTATVKAGRTVTWTNTSDVGHTVTAYEGEIPDEAAYFASGGFESERAAKNQVSEGLIASGDEYEHAFKEAGTYEYYCIPHESSKMVGTIQVK